jgi:hypothetical protein
MCASEAAVMAVGPGRKTTEQGLRVSDRERLAGWADRQAGAQRLSEEGGAKGVEDRAGRVRVVAKMEGRGKWAGRQKARTGPTQEEKNPFQISFKFWIW